MRVRKHDGAAGESSGFGQPCVQPQQGRRETTTHTLIPPHARTQRMQTTDSLGTIKGEYRGVPIDIYSLSSGPAITSDGARRKQNDDLNNNNPDAQSSTVSPVFMSRYKPQPVNQSLSPPHSYKIILTSTIHYIHTPHRRVESKPQQSLPYQFPVPAIRVGDVLASRRSGYQGFRIVRILPSKFLLKYLNGCNATVATAGLSISSTRIHLCRPSGS